ncbi:MAG: WYL domain-containing protein [Acidobacteria bacterium]|nr:WYL domain-containing protein [Acidobacteriota bacterium]
MPAEPTALRLQRILLLAPWVIARGRPTVEEVCSRFSITRRELEADLDLLFMCGLPPFGPGDLVEAYVEDDRVIIRMADWLARPMRLSHLEALGLLVAGRAIASLPGVEEAVSLRSALAKLEGALAPGEAKAAIELADRISVDLDAQGAASLGALRSAISSRRCVEIVYHSWSRDETTRREVDPLVIVGSLGKWYLVAMDHDTGEERTFRSDRIKEMKETGRTFVRPPGFDPARFSGGPVFRPSANGIEVVLDLAPEATWVVESVPSESAESLPGGWRRLTLRTRHLEWLVRLLLNLGNRARAVRPPELAEDLRLAAGRTLARYR